MNITWNGKKMLNDCQEHLTEEQKKLAVIANCLEQFKRELVPTSTMAGEINRIQGIALGALYRGGVFQDDIINRGCGYYQLKDAEQ